MIKNKHFKSAPKLTLQHDRSYNTPNSNKNAQQNDNFLPSNFQWSLKQLFSKQRNPKKNSPWCPCERIWSMGFRVLKEPLLIMPIKFWIIFLTMKSKKRGSIGRRRHVDAKKNGFQQKWVCGKSAQKHKDLKKYWGRWMREGWEAWKSVFFFKKKLWDEEEKSSGRGRRIVLMEEEKVMEEEAKREKREIWWMGGQNSAPTLKIQLSCWVNSVKLSWLNQLPKKKVFLFTFLFYFLVPLPKKIKLKKIEEEEEKNKKKSNFQKKKGWKFLE